MKEKEVRTVQMKENKCWWGKQYGQIRAEQMIIHTHRGINRKKSVQKKGSNKEKEQQKKTLVERIAYMREHRRCTE